MRTILVLLLLSGSAFAQTRTAVTRTAATRTAAGARSATTARYDLDRLWVLKGNPTKGVSTVATDPCATLSAAVGGLVGPTAFCLGPDGGSAGTQVDGGALVAFTAGAITPATVTASLCPNGPECAAMMFQRFDGGTGAAYKSANSASPTGNYSCVTVAAAGTAANGPSIIAKSGNIATFRLYLTGTTAVALVYKTGGVSTSVTSAANSVATRAAQAFGFSYQYVADGTSALTLYVDGASSGTPSTTAVGPLANGLSDGYEIGAWGAGTAALLDGRVYFAACSEDAWTAAEHLAIATAMRAVWTEQAQGSAITFTRASTAYCDPLDGGYGSWLANGVPCIIGGAYLSEPAATNLALNNNTFAGWTLGQANLSDGGVTTAPVLTAGGCPYPASDGTMTAALVDFPAMSDLAAAPGGYSALYRSYTGTLASWTQSVYIRAADALDGGTLYTTNALASPIATLGLDAGATWTRPPMTVASVAGNQYIAWGPDMRPGANQPKTQPALSVCLWEVQAELGSVATSPITNADTALTRAATVATVPNPLYGLNPSSWCVEGRILLPSGRTWAGGAANQYVLASGTHAAANSWRLYIGTVAKPIAYIIDAAGSAQTITADAAVADGAKTLAVCTSAGTPKLYVDGVQVAATVAGTTGVIGTQPATIYLGSASAAGSTVAYGSKWRAFTGEYRK